MAQIGKTWAVIGVLAWIVVSFVLVGQNWLPVVIDLGESGWQSEKDGAIVFDVRELKLRPCVIVGSFAGLIKYDDHVWEPATLQPVVPIPTYQPFSLFTSRWRISGFRARPDQILVRLNHVCDNGVIATDLTIIVPPEGS